MAITSLAAVLAPFRVMIDQLTAVKAGDDWKKITSDMTLNDQFAVAR